MLRIGNSIRGALLSLRDLFGSAYASKYLKSHGAEQELMAVKFFQIGVAAFIVARIDTVALLPPVVYGDFVTSVAADYWAMALMGASAVYYLGIHLNGHAPRLSSSLRLFGSLSHCATLGIFVLGSWSTAGADFFVICCGVFMLGFLRFAAMNLLDLFGAIKQRGR